MSFALDLLILATGWTHVLLSPYTKVEESFNLHATHDVLFYGISPGSLRRYDHFMFAGAVPRTFVGSVLLAWLSRPVITMANVFDMVESKFDLQIIIRLVLATINAFGLCLLRRAVARRFGRLTSLFFALLTCSQFHIPFWMGRTLPNMFAFFPVTLSTYLLLDMAPNAFRHSPSRVKMAISLLIFAAVVFRAELVLLLAPVALHQLLRGNIRFWELVSTGIITSLLSIALTIGVDSYFWNQWPLWPEYYSIYFNVYQGKSSDWGISPFHTYFTSSLPKLLLGSLPLSMLGCLLDPRIRSIVITSITFVFLISFLAHKEWRFVVYTVPSFNIAAAYGAKWMSSKRKGTFLGRILFMSTFGIVLANFAFTAVFTMASMANYPGGEALKVFNNIYGPSTEHVHVHISNLAAQTGASLFLQTNVPPYPLKSLNTSSKAQQLNWTYDKTENLSLKQLTSNKSITHLISELPPTRLHPQWSVVEGVRSFDRWRWELMGREDVDKMSLASALNIVRMVTSEKLWIAERESQSSRWF